MITGAHSVLFSTDAEADRAFLQDVIGLPSVDAGHGWLIFALPPAEVAVHPAGAPGHELFLMCDDIAAFMGQMAARGIACAEPHRERWGVLSRLTLPSGAELGVYEPTHPSPPYWSVKADGE